MTDDDERQCGDEHWRVEARYLGRAQEWVAGGTYGSYAAALDAAVESETPNRIAWRIVKCEVAR